MQRASAEVGTTYIHFLARALNARGIEEHPERDLPEKAVDTEQGRDCVYREWLLSLALPPGDERPLQLSRIRVRV